MVIKSKLKSLAVAAGVSAALIMSTGVAAHAATQTVGMSQVKGLMHADTGKVTGNKIIYSGANPHVVLETVLPGFKFPSFEVDHKQNPTLVFAAGVKKATITVINTNGAAAHSFMITKKSLPWPAIPNPKTMGGMADIPNLNPVMGGQFDTDTVTWKIPGPGTYHYLCRTPGHAMMGMWGTIIVK